MLTTTHSCTGHSSTEFVHLITDLGYCVGALEFFNFFLHLYLFKAYKSLIFVRTIVFLAVFFKNYIEILNIIPYSHRLGFYIVKSRIHININFSSYL